LRFIGEGSCVEPAPLKAISAANGRVLAAAWKKSVGNRMFLGGTRSGTATVVIFYLLSYHFLIRFEGYPWASDGEAVVFEKQKKGPGQLDFSHPSLSAALGALWTFPFCKLLILKELVGAKGFEPSTSWSRARVAKILDALSGVASGPRPDFLPLLIVCRLSVNWVTNGNRPQIYASSKVNHLQFVLHNVWACDSARLPRPPALGSARFQHFPPQEPVCLGLVAWATLF